MKKQFVSYKIALALKELGFDEPCLAGWSNIYSKDEPDGYFYINYNDEISDIPKIIGYNHIKCKAPLWQQVIQWFIERNIILYVEHSSGIWTGVVEYSEEYFEKDFDEEFLNLSKKECHYLARKWPILKAIELCQKK